MPSRKFSVNSHASVSSQKTSVSSTNEAAFYRRAASVQQIGELYTALNELIRSSHVKRSKNGDSYSVRRKSQWSSEENLLDKRKLYPRANSETTHLRTARSASCLSSKSCYAAIGSKKVPAKVISRSAETPKSGGICWKLVAKFRGKKLGEQWKLTEQKHIKGGGPMKNINGENVHTIDDLLEMAKLHANEYGKSNSKDKRSKVKAPGRTKAHSFDSSEAGTPNICVHKVSSKLKTWYTRAASYAATIEDEDKSRTESFCTGSTENVLEKTEYESKGQKTDEEIIVKDFDVSSNDALEDSKPEDLEPENKDELAPDTEERVSCRARKFERRAYSDLNSKKSTLLLESSNRKYGSNGDPFDVDEMAASKILSQTLQKSEKRCNLIRRLSLNIVEDVLAGQSASCVQIGSLHLNRDMSKRKVQQWLKDLHTNDERNTSVKCKESEDVLSSNGNVDNRTVNEKSDHSPGTITVDTKRSENVEESDNLSKERSLLGQALFYIPNIGQAEQPASVNIILNF